MPFYRLTPPGEIVEADELRREHAHTVLVGMTLVIGKPREVVLRRVPSSVAVEIVNETSYPGLAAGPPRV